MKHGVSTAQLVINRWIWACIAALALVDGVWMAACGMRVNATQLLFVARVLLGCLALSAYYRFVRRDDTIFLFAQVGCQIIAGTLVLAVFSYVSSQLAFPLQDETYVAIDAALGFHWRESIAAFDRVGWLVDLLALAYKSSEVQLMLCMPLLFFVGHAAHIQRFLLAFLYSGALTIVISALVPATAGFAYFKVAQSELAHIDVAYGLQHMHDLMALRARSLEVLPLEMKGLVTFPSFHATIAVLLVYLCWPIGWLRVVSLPVNALMVVSTLTSGGHYLSDMLAGLVIAWHSVWLARKCLPAVKAL